MKTKQNVVIGITSGIAAYRSLELITLLRSKNIEVFVVMTKNATRMVPISDFEKASGNKVYVELFEENFDYRNTLKLRKVDHIDLANKADVMIIAPATANTIAKLAYGLADDFLTTTLLAVTAPVIICPSMNVNMWNNPIVQENIAKLKQREYQIIDPENGLLACGYEGQGRLVNIDTIKDSILEKLDLKTP